MYSKKSLAEALGKAIGILFQSPGMKTIYGAGDTVWRSDVDQTLEKFMPDMIILNAGDARMVSYTGSIIVGKDDVLHAAQAAPSGTIVASHMEAITI